MLCRLIRDYDPTLILDEFDNWLPKSKGLISLLNGGHQQGYTRARCHDNGYEVSRVAG
jgi:hypothetical protein